MSQAPRPHHNHHKPSTTPSTAPHPPNSDQTTPAQTTPKTTQATTTTPTTLTTTTTKTEAVEEFHIFPTRNWTLDIYFCEPLVSGNHSPRCTCVSPRLLLGRISRRRCPSPSHWKSGHLQGSLRMVVLTVFSAHFAPFFGLHPLGRESRLFWSPRWPTLVGRRRLPLHNWVVMLCRHGDRSCLKQPQQPGSTRFVLLFG